ncbi:MAG: hypothetical protein K8T90_07730 [Planctomycetes bacterium]|nr:hypothetical protein [Planctomycetota bacterium]
MGSLIHRGETGVWVSNGHRNDFLDWFAAHRCQPNDERWQYCKSEGHRWTGFCLDLDDLLRSAEVLELTADELARAKQEHGFEGPQLLAVISKVTKGEWPYRNGDLDAQYWRVPWIYEPGFTAPNAWSQEFFGMNLAFASPDAKALAAATEALWSHSHLQGCWIDNTREPLELPPVSPKSVVVDSARTFGSVAFEGVPSVYGLARLHGRFIVPCMNHFGLAPAYMFLELSINATALRGVNHPTPSEEGVCGPRLFEWFAELGRRVHRAVPIRVGIIGWEPTTPADEEIRARTFRDGDLYGYLLPRGALLEFTPPQRFSEP